MAACLSLPSVIDRSGGLFDRPAVTLPAMGGGIIEKKRLAMNARLGNTSSLHRIPASKGDATHARGVPFAWPSFYNRTRLTMEEC
jgi:hypothetical protein